MISHPIKQPTHSTPYSLYPNYAIHREIEKKPIFFTDDSWKDTSSNQVNLWHSSSFISEKTSSQTIFFTKAKLIEKYDHNLSFEYEQTMNLILPKQNMIPIKSHFIGYKSNRPKNITEDNILL